MHMFDLIDKYKESPDVVNVLLRHSLGKSCTFYAPDDVSPKYMRFCKALTLPESPHVLVLPDNYVSPMGRDTFGYFYPPSNVVVLAQSVFDKFQQDKPFGDYIVGHELGHAKSALTRRHFMEKALAYAGGAASFAATYGGVTGASHIINEPVDAEKEPGVFYASEGVKVAGAGLAGMLTSKQIKAWFVRDEEFRADDFAVQVASRADVMDAIESHLVESRSRKFPEEFKDMQTRFAQAVVEVEKVQGKPMSPELKRMNWVRTLDGTSGLKPLSLKNFLKPNYYPTMGERFTRLHQQERDGADPSR